MGLLSRRERSRHPQSVEATLLDSVLSVFDGSSFTSTLTEAINPVYFLNHTTIAPKHRHSFFPMDLMFEWSLRNDPNAFFRQLPDPKLFTSSTFLNVPYHGLHSLLLRCPPFTLDQEALRHLFSILFVELSGPDSRQEVFNILFGCFPPPLLIDTFLSSQHLVRADKQIWVSFLTLFRNMCALTAPFDACLSLATVFKMLTPLESRLDQLELNLLRRVGEIVVALQWYNIPSDFDSPLLCHLPSLAGAQRGILQTLSSYSGIPSLVATLTVDSHRRSLNSMKSDIPSLRDRVACASLIVHSLSHDALPNSLITPPLAQFLVEKKTSLFPAHTSAVFEFCSRFITVSSDAVRMDLVKHGMLDGIVLAVSNSSFLDDYEKGTAMIGILLATIWKDHQKRKMREFDFSEPAFQTPRPTLSHWGSLLLSNISSLLEVLQCDDEDVIVDTLRELLKVASDFIISTFNKIGESSPPPAVLTTLARISLFPHLEIANNSLDALCHVAQGDTTTLTHLPSPIFPSSSPHQQCSGLSFLAALSKKLRIVFSEFQANLPTDLSHLPKYIQVTKDDPFIIRHSLLFCTKSFLVPILLLRTNPPIEVDSEIIVELILFVKEALPTILTNISTIDNLMTSLPSDSSPTTPLVSGDGNQIADSLKMLREACLSFLGESWNRKGCNKQYKYKAYT
ncbi:hypothetical protein BLNAU_3884 [Blattamonas nauphoetae]|uniref:Uncharacterized protein n=1 Tax=Blattamonas nauphoetae TaxID=2049346 RepID=A0ABQ9YBT0_9EUKA|nr:hypothetical protein BLNAU_3884 [Blattamonas nauphoetae]